MKTQLELNVSSRGAMSGVLTMGSLDPAFAAATEVQGEPVVVDLRTVEFVEPAGLCGLAALLEFLCARCEDVSLTLPGRDVPAYLERMNFFRIFGNRIGTNADVESLEERRRHNPGTLQELINFHTEEEPIGMATLYDFRKGGCDLGIKIGPNDLRGRGLASEAVRLLVEYVFDTLGLENVRGSTLSHNHRMQRVFEKNGFEQDGDGTLLSRYDNRRYTELFYTRRRDG